MTYFKPYVSTLSIQFLFMNQWVDSSSYKTTCICNWLKRLNLKSTHEKWSLPWAKVKRKPTYLTLSIVSENHAFKNVGHVIFFYQKAWLPTKQSTKLEWKRSKSMVGHEHTTCDIVFLLSLCLLKVQSRWAKLIRLSLDWLELVQVILVITRPGVPARH